LLASRLDALPVGEAQAPPLYPNQSSAPVQNNVRPPLNNANTPQATAQNNNPTIPVNVSSPPSNHTSSHVLSNVANPSTAESTSSSSLSYKNVKISSIPTPSSENTTGTPSIPQTTVKPEHNPMGSTSNFKQSDGPKPYMGSVDNSIHDLVNHSDEKGLEKLLMKKINIEVWNDNGTTAVHTAAANGNTKMLRLLLNHSPKALAIPDAQQAKPLHHAAANNQIQAMIMLLDRGANVEEHDKYQFTPLHHASKNGHTKAMSLLLDREAKVDSRDQRQTPPLHYAAREGHVGAVQCLLNRGADINSKTSANTTALHSAVGNNHIETAKLLIDRGADINAYDHNVGTALQLACAVGHAEVVEMLLERQARLEETHSPKLLPAFGCAATMGQIRIMKMLRDAGANIFATDETNFSSLHAACYNGQCSTVELLLDWGLSMEEQSKYGTALHVAASDGHLEVVKLLVARGANLNARNRDGATPLGVALLSGHKNVVSCLNEVGNGNLSSILIR
jgi:ankyrin repeat protein